MDLLDTQVHALIGDAGFTRLVRAFYARILSDDLLGPLYPQNDLSGAERRLRDFLIMRFGGPQRYLQERGHPRLRMRHARFPVNQAARDRWVEVMEHALAEAETPAPAAKLLRSFFRDSATFLINRADS